MKIPFYLITPEKIVYQDEVDSVSLPTVDGEITILPNHIPLITALGHGVITLKNGNDTHFLSVSEGVVKVDKMGLTVLATSADRATELVMEDVQKALDDAKRMAEEKKTSETEFLQAMALVARETSRLHALRRHRSHKGMSIDQRDANL